VILSPSHTNLESHRAESQRIKASSSENSIKINKKVRHAGELLRPTNVGLIVVYRREFRPFSPRHQSTGSIWARGQSRLPVHSDPSLRISLVWSHDLHKVQIAGEGEYRLDLWTSPFIYIQTKESLTKHIWLHTHPTTSTFLASRKKTFKKSISRLAS
jgi:hypothetical protein